MGQTPQSPTQWLDFHEISTLLAIEANQPDPASAKSAAEILAMRRAGEAWEDIARALGCKDVDAIINPNRTPNRPRGPMRHAALSTRRIKAPRRHVA